jgi:acyl-CoA synthetase (AMP-forming)/AMP-acid ligase II
VSWLPLYHDMGLIGCLWFPLWSGALSVQMAASDWLLEPDLLFKHVDASGATFCWLPNFAFSYLAAQRERMRGPFALGGMRAWINCSEPVRQKSMHAFADGFADWGVRRSQLQASYAMAESVFAVTQTPLGAVPTVVDRQSVVRSHTRYSPLAFDLIDDIFVSSGRPIDGMRVRVANAGVSSPAGECGEIQISSDCLFSGYWGADGYVTSAFTADGWYSTGDFGFLRGGELFVIGRTKDVVIIGGQNVFPEDVETIVNTVPGIYPGRVIAFGVGDEQMATESLVVIAEQRGPYDRDGAIALQRHIQQLVLATIGIAPRLAYVVPERWIVKSTAGKLSRRDTRERFLAERDRLARGAFVNAV